MPAPCCRQGGRACGDQANVVRRRRKTGAGLGALQTHKNAVQPGWNGWESFRGGLFLTPMSLPDGAAVDNRFATLVIPLLEADLRDYSGGCMPR